MSYEEFTSDLKYWLSINEQGGLENDTVSIPPIPIVCSATGMMKANNLRAHHAPKVRNAIKEELKNKGNSIVDLIEKNKFEIVYEAIPHLGNGCVIENYSNQYFTTQPITISTKIDNVPFQFIYWISSPLYIENDEEDDNEEEHDENENNDDSINEDIENGEETVPNNGDVEDGEDESGDQYYRNLKINYIYKTPDLQFLVYYSFNSSTSSEEEPTKKICL